MDNKPSLQDEIKKKAKVRGTIITGNKVMIITEKDLDVTIVKASIIAKGEE